MATITVTGTVTRLFFNDKGVEISEIGKGKDGQPVTRKYVAWFDQPVNFREGAHGTFAGNLSATLDKWTNPDGSAKLDNSGQPGVSVKVAINSPVFTPSTVAAAPVVDNSMPF